MAFSESYVGEEKIDQRRNLITSYNLVCNRLRSQEKSFFAKESVLLSGKDITRRVNRKVKTCNEFNSYPVHSSILKQLVPMIANVATQIRYTYISFCY